MTLVLSLTNTQYSVIVADRRLTYADGSVRTDEQTKLTTFTCADGRFGVAFSGLAEYGSLRTEAWLLSQLLELGPPDFTARAIIERFRQAATARWRTIRLPDPSHKRASFVFSGFDYTETPPRGVALKLSNWELENSYRHPPMDEFVLTGLVERRPRRPHSDMGAVLITGMLSIVPDSEIDTFGRMLERRVSPATLVSRAVTAIRSAADKPAAGGGIGKRCLSLVVPREPSEDAFSEYHSMEAASVIYAANAITVTPSFQGAVLQPQFRIEPPSS